MVYCDYDYLNVLGAFCVCKDLGVERSQQLICTELIEKNMGKIHLFDIKLENNEPCLITNGRSTPLQFFFELHDKKRVAAEYNISGIQELSYSVVKSGNVSENTILHLKAQLSLYWKMCDGNVNNTAIISASISSELLKMCIKCEFLCLDYDLRAHFVCLFNELFVDIIGNNPVLSRDTKIYPWTPIEIDNQGFNVSVTGAVNEHFEWFHELVIGKSFFRNEVSSFFKEVKRQLLDEDEFEESHTGHADFIIAMLKIVVLFFENGYYKTWDAVNDILIMMNEDIFLFRKEVRESISESTNDQDIQRTEKIDEIFKLSLQIVELVLKFQRNHICSKFIKEFKKSYLRAHTTRDHSTIIKVMSITELSDMFHKSGAFHKFAASQNCDELDILRDIMLDLAEVGDNTVTKMSLQILNKLHLRCDSLFNAGVSTLILDSKSTWDTFKAVETISYDVYDIIFDHQIDEKESALLCSLSQSLLDILQKAGTHEKQRYITQQIILRSNVIHDSLDIFNQDLDDNDLETDEMNVLKNALLGVLNVAKTVAINNPVVGSLLFDEMNSLFHSNYIKYPDAILVLAETYIVVFSMRKFALQITQKHVNDIVQLLIDSNSLQPSLLNLLRVICVADGKDAIPRNQIIITNAIMKYEENLLAVFRDQDSKYLIWTVKAGNELKPTHNLTYHIALVRLLAVLAEGENKFIESICKVSKFTMSLQLFFYDVNISVLS